MSADVDVLVIGGGIAGWSAAYHAARVGRSVVVVDAQRHRASDLPVALVNPLRGHTGRLVARGVEGMDATFATIDRLRDAGHRIAAARGLYRPLIDVGPEASQAAYWATRLAGLLAFDWHARAPATLGLAVPVPALHLRDAGWVAAPDLLAALRVESAAAVVDDRVVELQTDGRGGGMARLASGASVVANTLLWCGGAWGAAQRSAASDAGAIVQAGQPDGRRCAADRRGDVVRALRGADGLRSPGRDAGRPDARARRPDLSRGPGGRRRGRAIERPDRADLRARRRRCTRSGAACGSRGSRRPRARRWPASRR